MIAIPNMEMPKTCHECRLHLYDWGNEYVLSHDVCHPLRKGFNSKQFDGGRQVDTFHEVHPDCPLIDIVTCGECKWWNEETHGCNRNPSVGAWWESDFCSYGERRE